MRGTLAIELIDDCVFSARAATEGGHTTLDRIPGGALLGVAASRLYRHLDPRDAYAAFHSGRLRFGDGLPLAGDSVGYPVPHAWHHPKTARPDADGRLLAERIHNFVHLKGLDETGSGETQPKQLRNGYIHADGQWSKPARALRLKTAVDADTGGAAKSQLFGYEALERGQRFAAAVEADADFDAALFERILEALTGDILLGRSRAAEYGRARVTPADITAPEAGTSGDHTITLWLLSDLALCDDQGQPTLTPDAESLGLADARVLWDRTFLRTRRYSPWNAARRGYDRERWILGAGGVITLAANGPLPSHEITRLQAGIGLHREAGLGRLWVNPPLLATAHPQFAPVAARAPTPPPCRPTHPLIDWLESADDGWKVKAEQAAAELADRYFEHLRIARRARGVPEHVPFGPSKAQWGRILEAARTRSGGKLFSALFEGNGAIVKVKGEGWREETLDPGKNAGEDGGWVTLAVWLEKELDPKRHGSARAYAHRVRQLAHRVQNRIDHRSR